MRAAFAALLLLVVPILAGCLGGSRPVPSTSPPYAFVDPLSSDASHDHRDRNQHQGHSNVTLVAHEPLVDQEGDTSNSHSIDLCDHWLVLGREREGQNGVDFVDVADPAAPVWVGRYRDPNAVAGDRDVAWSADCNYVFMANQGTRPDNSGVLVINAKDKAQPVYESRYLIPGVASPLSPIPSVSSGVHAIFASRVGATQYVYALNYGVHILRATTDANGKLALQLAGRYATADAEQLQAVNEGGVDQVATRRTIYGHDMTVYVEAGRTILYVAYAYDGLRIVDITDPAATRELGHWVPDMTPGAPHYVHSVKSYLRADGRRITVLGSETFEERNTNTPSPLWLLDTTDPSRIGLISTWVNPGLHGSDHLLFSLHYYELDGELLWVTHYHGGVWVLDISDPVRPSVKGTYMPAQDTGFTPRDDCCAGWKWAAMPLTFDIKVRDGVAYAADFHTGLYVMRLA